MTNVPVPTLIRGVLYPSMSAAARALGVVTCTVSQAMDDGWLDRVGLGRPRGVSSRPDLRKPCWFRGKRYPSRTAAALAHGVTVAAVSLSVSRARQAARQMAA